MPVPDDMDFSENHIENDDNSDDDKPEEQLSIHGRFMVSSRRLPRADEVLEHEQRQYRLTALPVSEFACPSSSSQ